MNVEDAFDMLDHFLHNNLDDADYQEYLLALTTLYNSTICFEDEADDFVEDSYYESVRYSEDDEKNN